MLNNKPTTLLLLALLILMAIPAIAKKGPTDDQLKALCRDASYTISPTATEEANHKAFMLLAQKLESQTDISRLTGQQVSMIMDFGGIQLRPYLSRWLTPHIEQRAQTGDAAFCYLAWHCLPSNNGFTAPDSLQVATLSRFLHATALQQTLDAYPDAAQETLMALGNFKSTHWLQADMVAGALNLLRCRLPETAIADCRRPFNSAIQAEGLSHDLQEQLRHATIAQYQKLQQSDSRRLKREADTQLQYLNGPFACGTLVGSQAPDMHITRAWRIVGDSVQTLPLTTLHEVFRQPNPPVVMLDFWGTKCVPCLASFPELAELQRHYADAPVLILGVTSLQGYFVDTPNHRTIQCNGQPEKELSLFPAYMKAMDMNWTVAITQEDVMNTDYGALAIPHVVLIDRQGIVRHNALNADIDTKIQLIDQLLR